jgi:hypothetical protein
MVSVPVQECTNQFLRLFRAFLLEAKALSNDAGLLRGIVCRDSA